MRQFSSYGPINKKLHYYVPRRELLRKAHQYLVGEVPDEGGHYITVWAPRQTGKSSLLRDIYWELLPDERYCAANIDVQEYLLHGVALIGVRSVVGLENKTGSPFNVQRSLHVKNLTEGEVNEMYHWYGEETGQNIEQEVIDRIYYVTQGHPGLVSWFGELITREYNKAPLQPLTIKHFKYTYMMALQGIPNNTIINIISKAEREPYRHKVLELFKTGFKGEFRFENPEISYLYMNGIISYEQDDDKLYIRFPCQFIQEKLFDHFSGVLVQHSRQLLANPFIDLSLVINKQEINIRKLLELYQEYFNKNREELLQYAQRRVDMRVMEVVYHFQFYSWLDAFLSPKGVRILPEFPAGNGKIDLLIRYAGVFYGLELKSFVDTTELQKSVRQAAEYGKKLGLETITLVVFTETPLPDELMHQYAAPFSFNDSSTVHLFFLVTG